jgi:hypothetical protein
MRRSLPVSCSLLLVISVALACDDPEDPKQDDTADSGLMCEEEEEPASEEGGEEPPVGPASGATCPTENPPTYESFGQSFMQTYCTRCHSSELTGDARMCAPLYHDFGNAGGRHSADARGAPDARPVDRLRARQDVNDGGGRRCRGVVQLARA